MNETSGGRSRRYRQLHRRRFGERRCLMALNILQAIERLELFPESDRIVPEINEPSIRELLYGNYRIIYRVRETLVEILTIYHSARLLDLRRIAENN